MSASTHLLAMGIAMAMFTSDDARAEQAPPLGYALPDRPVSADRTQEHENKKLFLEVGRRMFVERDLGAIDRHYAEDYVNHDPERQQRARAMGMTDRQMTRAFFTQLLDAFPDVTLTIDQLYAEGDRVFAFTTWRGTHLKPFMGMPPSGKPVVIRAADIFRIKGGQFREHWDIADQSGLMPAPPTAAQ